MLIAQQFTVPDKCPKDCPFKSDIKKFGQNSICARCPVLLCDDSGRYGAMVNPEGIRPDWAEEWQEFFKDYKKIPQLNFTIKRK